MFAAMIISSINWYSKVQFQQKLACLFRVKLLGSHTVVWYFSQFWVGISVGRLILKYCIFCKIPNRPFSFSSNDPSRYFEVWRMVYCWGDIVIFLPVVWIIMNYEGKLYRHSKIFFHWPPLLTRMMIAGVWNLQLLSSSTVAFCNFSPRVYRTEPRS